jgi:hypothetical protein
MAILSSISPEKVVSPVPSPPSAAEPIFILGSVRSGTSAMVNALREGARLPGHHEANVAPLMQMMIDVVDGYFSNLGPEYLAAKDAHLIASLDPKAIETWVRNYFAAVYETKMGPGRWISKSPDGYLHAPMVRASKLLAEMFPKAKFIFCLRRGIENVMSRQRKFPTVPFNFHCESWAHTIEEWLRVKPLLCDRAIEVDQRDIATRPAKVANDLAAFLDLTEQQKKGVLRVFQGPRQEQTQTPQEHRELDLDDTPWSEEQRQEFLHHCLPAMKAAGFRVEGDADRPRDAGEPFRLRASEAVHTDVHPEWGLAEIDASTFQIRPNAPGGPKAELAWLEVPLKGKTRFVVDLRLAHAESHPVWIEMRIEHSSNRHVYVAERMALGETLGWHHCELTFSRLAGTCDVYLSVQMAPGATTSDHAFAQFRDARIA